MSKYNFKLHIIDRSLPVDFYAQIALADLDNDGRLEYILGRRYGTIYWYKMITPEHWVRHVLGENSPSAVGGCVLDVDGDGWLDFVSGGAWYRNPAGLDQPFQRIVFDSELAAVHDILAADVDSDGKQEIITLSDENNLRWYKIPDDPTQPWQRFDIGPGVHSGIAVGDIDGDGDIDIVRTNVWFENVNGDGRQWQVRPIGPNSPPPPDFTPYFAYDATKVLIRDMNHDGINDLVFTDAEIPGGKIWWMQNVDGKGREWKRHEIPNADPIRRGAYHSLAVLDFDGDGDLDVFTCEMENVGGDRSPRYYIWENLDGNAEKWQEHVILDANLGGHEAVTGDITGNGLTDIIAKPWNPVKTNAFGGEMFIVFLENLGPG